MSVEFTSCRNCGEIIYDKFARYCCDKCEREHTKTGPWFLGQSDYYVTEDSTGWQDSLPKQDIPLKRQVGGDHYKNSKIQPIEVIRDWDLGFECGNALKYIARHLKKGEPKKDIEKAIHYLQMYLENLDV